MAASPLTNRAMFWRIVRRFISANPGRLVVILLALGAGAAVTAALLNLQVDAQRRLTTEFRAFGANVVITPLSSQNSPKPALLNEATLEHIPPSIDGRPIHAAPFLSVLGEVSLEGEARKNAKQAVITGTALRSLPLLFPSWKYELYLQVRGQKFDKLESFQLSGEGCLLGAHVAKQIDPENEALVLGTKMVLRSGSAEETCEVSDIFSAGGPEDDQVFTDLSTAQHLAALSGRVSLIQLSVPGTAPEIQTVIVTLRQRLPDADVRPIRQFTEGEAKIYTRISGVLTATVALVLVLTALCVMAAMTNVAMERRNDVGLMKAIGGATRRVLRLFLTEAALLGLTGGVIGAAIGILLSMWLGKVVFGVAARPRLIVYPVAVALTVIVAIAGAYPLRRLANIRPASVFRGEA